MENVTMTQCGSSATSRTLPERRMWLQPYEKMVCVTCGEPLKRYLAHYPLRKHIRCLLSTGESSELVSCWERAYFA